MKKITLFFTVYLFIFGAISVRCVEQNPDIFAIDGIGSVFTSSDDGVNWSNVNPGNEINGAKELVSDNDNVLYILDGNSQVFKSVNGGGTWQIVNFDYNGLEAKSDWLTMACSTNNNMLFIIEKNGDDVWRSANQGETWQKVNDNYNGGVNPRPKGAATDTEGNLFVVDGNADVWKSEDNGENWVKINDDYNGIRNNYADDYIIANGDHFIAMGVAGASYVFKSTDGGYNFEDMGKITPYGATAAMTFIEGSIYAAVNYGNTAPNIHSSYDEAGNWNKVGEIQTPFNIIDMTSFYHPQVLLSDDFLSFDSSLWQIVVENTGYYTIEDQFIRLNTGTRGECHLFGKDGYILNDQTLVMKIRIRSNFNHILGNDYSIGFRNIYNSHENMIELNRLWDPLYGPNLDNYTQYRLVNRDEFGWTTCGLITAPFTDFLEIRYECSLAKVEVFINDELALSCSNNITEKVLYPYFHASNADIYVEKSLDIDSIEIYYSR